MPHAHRVQRIDGGRQQRRAEDEQPDAASGKRVGSGLFHQAHSPFPGKLPVERVNDEAWRQRRGKELPAGPETPPEDGLKALRLEPVEVSHKCREPRQYDREEDEEASEDEPEFFHLRQFDARHTLTLVVPPLAVVAASLRPLTLRMILHRSEKVVYIHKEHPSYAK
ncbi:hypothetical protein SDC9_202128 [bioreactor metagenome]|uniref:Uncharacterized protein n=1 Tax=bioreactor metagenome TaxID=1076179 RepID=A0A645ISV7_9ZZZZ